MLIISRRVLEDFELTIPSETVKQLAEGQTAIVIKLLSIERHHARIGIEAPKAVKVLRSELKGREEATARVGKSGGAR